MKKASVPGFVVLLALLTTTSALAQAGRASHSTTTKFVSKRYSYEIVLPERYATIQTQAATQWTGDFPFGASGQVDVIADDSDRKFIVAAMRVVPGTSLRDWQATVAKIKRQACTGLRGLHGSSLDGVPAREFINVGCPADYDVITLVALHRERGYLFEFVSPKPFSPASDQRNFDVGRRAFRFSASPVPLASGSAVGTVTVTMRVAIADDFRTCPPGTPARATGCFSRKGAANVQGLGRVEESWDPVVDETPADCGPASLRFLPSTARFTVSGKGAIDVQVNGACMPFNPPAPVVGDETFTVTGGSGKFAGASGAGTIKHFSNGPGAPGLDTWSGNLVVPGFEFDLTPPTITGAADERVRAPRNTQRIRVRFHVSARDDVDGAVPVACQPKSGSFFPVGRRTVVRCSATDTSANKQTAQFAITVRPRPGA